MALTQADIDTLDAAILARGLGQTVQSITFSDRVLTYAMPPSIDDLLQLRAWLVGVVDGGVSATRHRYAATSKGV